MRCKLAGKEAACQLESMQVRSSDYPRMTL